MERGEEGTSPARRGLGWLLFGVVGGLVAISAVLEVLVGGTEDVVFGALGSTAALVYAAAGSTIVARHPRNTIGWLLWWISLWLVIVGLGEAYSGASAARAPDLFPGTPWAVWLANLAIAPLLDAIPLVLLLFPTGRPPSPRWRWVVWLILASTALATLGFAVRTTPFTVGPEDSGVVVGAPLPVSATLSSVLLTASGPGSLLGAILAIAGLVVRYRRSVGIERQQLRWLAALSALGAALLVGMFASIWLTGEDHWLPTVFFMSIAAVIALGIPTACWVAILRHGLYRLDVVIKKTVLYVTLATLIAGIGGLVFVLVAGRLTASDSSGADSPLALLMTGVVMGLLVMPFRRFATRVANRVVYGRRASPYEVLTRFAGRVGETYSTEDVLPRMAVILGEATGASTARVWVRIGGRLMPEASWPAGAPEVSPIGSPPDELPVFPPGEHPVAVRHQGELLGALSVTMPPADPMNPAREKLVRDLAEQAGLVLRNVRLIEELRASRQRLVTAQDSERRRIERNIHDGAQQQLVALAIRLRLATQMVDRDPDKAKELLGELQVAAQEALDDLRDLARGIYPPLLADQGLVAALESQVRKAVVPVTVQADGEFGRFPQEVESAVYFCVLEALQNVAKYAEASRAAVRLFATDGHVAFEVTDDGRGFDPAVARGSGLQGMADRVDALGGSLEVHSAPGAGTTVRGAVPAVRAEGSR